MYQKLEINRLDNNGQVSRMISCLAGRLTVFRANSEEEIELYYRALAGWKTKDRFSIILDGNNFSANQHSLIGFGEAFAAEPGNTSVAQFLERCGVAPADIEALLLDFGLGGLSDQACKLLGPAQERLLRIIGACQKPGSVVVLNDPFEPVAELWRERCAQLLTDFAWNKKAIVVVVRLSYRPECWIENEHISRVQLERPRKRTIGFGMDGAGTLELINKLRADNSSPASANNTAKNLLAPISGAFSSISESKSFPYRTIAMLAIFAAVVTYVVETYDAKTSLQSSLTSINIKSTETVSGDQAIESAHVIQPGAVLDVTVLQGQGATKKAGPVYALDLMPEETKDAIVEAFNNPSAVTEKQRLRAQQNLQSPVVKHEPVQKLNYQAENETAAYNQVEAAEPPEEISEEDLEARREEIRRKFLEAIQRSGIQQSPFDD